MNWDICFRIVADGENEDFFFLYLLNFCTARDKWFVKIGRKSITYY